MEKNKNNSSARYGAMEQIQWYIQENQLKPHTQLPGANGSCVQCANESFHSPYSYSNN